MSIAFFTLPPNIRFDRIHTKPTIYQHNTPFQLQLMNFHIIINLICFLYRGGIIETREYWD